MKLLWEHSPAAHMSTTYEQAHSGVAGPALSPPQEVLHTVAYCCMMPHAVLHHCQADTLSRRQASGDCEGAEPHTNGMLDGRKTPTGRFISPRTRYPMPGCSTRPQVWATTNIGAHPSRSLLSLMPQCARTCCSSAVCSPRPSVARATAASACCPAFKRTSTFRHACGLQTQLLHCQLHVPGPDSHAEELAWIENPPSSAALRWGNHAADTGLGPWSLLLHAPTRCTTAVGAGTLQLPLWPCPSRGWGVSSAACST